MDTFSCLFHCSSVSNSNMDAPPMNVDSGQESGGRDDVAVISELEDNNNSM